MLRQDCGDFELIIIDDGSGPGVAELVESFEDPRIRYEWHENSGGPARPRNRGIALAQGEWICFLDHDDVWSPNKLSRVKDVIEANSVLDMIFHNEYHVDDSGKVLRSVVSGPVEANLYRKMLVWGNRFSTSAVALRRSFLEENHLTFSEDPAFVTAEDFDLWLRVTCLPSTIVGVDDVLGAYFGESGASTDFERHIQARHEVVRHHVCEVPVESAETARFHKQAESSLEFDLAKAAAGDHSIVMLVEHLLRALRLSPSTAWMRANNAMRRGSYQRAESQSITWGASE